MTAEKHQAKHSDRMKGIRNFFDTLDRHEYKPKKRNKTRYTYRNTTHPYGDNR